MHFSRITHQSTLAYCKILYVNNLRLEKTKSLSHTCNEETNRYNISTFEPIQFYIDNNAMDFILILSISKIKLNGNLFSRIQSTHALYLHSGQLKFHPIIKLVQTKFYCTNIRQLKIIEISKTKITKQHSMKGGSNTKCKNKIQRAAEENKYTFSHNCLSVQEKEESRLTV